MGALAVLPLGGLGEVADWRSRADLGFGDRELGLGDHELGSQGAPDEPPKLEPWPAALGAEQGSLHPAQGAEDLHKRQRTVVVV